MGQACRLSHRGSPHKLPRFDGTMFSAKFSRRKVGAFLSTAIKMPVLRLIGAKKGQPEKSDQNKMAKIAIMVLGPGGSPARWLRITIRAI